MEKTAELYPMYGLWHTPWWQTDWFFYTLISGIFVLVCSSLLLMVRWLRAKRSRKQPWEIALRRIAEMHTKVTCSEGFSSKELYLHLTIILKNYLYGRYGFDVESKTDEELLIFLEQTSLDKDFICWFREIFENGVRAKFAQESITITAVECDMKHAIDFIKRTIPESSR